MSANSLSRSGIGLYPQNLNTREKKVIEAVNGNPLLRVKSIAASGADYAILAKDGFDTFIVTDAVTITMPVAADNEGRKISFVQKAAAVLTVAQNADDANIGGADENFVSMDAAGDRAEFICDGAQWLTVSSTIAA